MREVSNGRIAVDFTFSVPKSVSMHLALTHDAGCYVSPLLDRGAVGCGTAVVQSHCAGFANQMVSRAALGNGGRGCGRRLPRNPQRWWTRIINPLVIDSSQRHTVRSRA